jgi:hypothetical protein
MNFAHIRTYIYFIPSFFFSWAKVRRTEGKSDGEIRININLIAVYFLWGLQHYDSPPLHFTSKLRDLCLKKKGMLTPSVFLKGNYQYIFLRFIRSSHNHHVGFLWVPVQDISDWGGLQRILFILFQCRLLSRILTSSEHFKMVRNETSLLFPLSWLATFRSKCDIYVYVMKCRGIFWSVQIVKHRKWSNVLIWK